MSYLERREKLYEWMGEQGVALLIIEDCERSRDSALRYLTGQPGDGLLFLSAEKKCLLVPWDINMAKIYAESDDVLPYTDFGLDPFAAAKAAVSHFKTPYGARIEVPASTSYPSFLKYIENLGGYDILCREEGSKAKIEEMRAKKDTEERRIYSVCAEKTNEIIAALEKGVMEGALKSEVDAALFIENECRLRGCEGTGFTTLAAGAARSFGIHCFPSYTAQIFGGKGLSILDFGVNFQGYTSDVTLTFARALTKKQKEQVKLVEEAFDLAFDLISGVFNNKNEAASTSAREIALAIDDFFKRGKYFMPHGLGHGIGLQAHEKPFLRRAADNNCLIERSMIFTLEPGLYDPDLGGVRLENDVLAGEEGAEILTRSKIVYL